MHIHIHIHIYIGRMASKIDHLFLCPLIKLIFSTPTIYHWPVRTCGAHPEGQGEGQVQSKGKGEIYAWCRGGRRSQDIGPAESWSLQLVWLHLQIQNYVLTELDGILCAISQTSQNAMLYLPQCQWSSKLGSQEAHVSNSDWFSLWIDNTIEPWMNEPHSSGIFRVPTD